MAPAAKRRNFPVWRSALAAGLVGAISWTLAGRSRADAPTGAAPSSVAAARDADAYLTALSTDKPIYREGENVYVRGMLLQAYTRQPLAADHSVLAQLEIRDPKGAVVYTGSSQTDHGTFGTEWEIPEGQAGGEYTLRVSYPYAGYPAATRKFDVRAYRVPRLKTEIVFLRDGYAPGDTVTATLQATRAEGGIPAGAKVTAQAVVDGVTVATQTLALSSDGRCTARFALPAKIVSGDGTLAMTVEDGGVVESTGKSIPILLSTVDVAVYPEGGDLVVGLPGDVYFEARRKNGKPADIAGEVLNAQGVAVANFRTEHEGRGSFVIPQVAAGGYTLHITQPPGLTTPATVSADKLQGLVLHALKESYAADEPIEVAVGGNPGAAAEVRLSKRAVQLDDQFLLAGAPAAADSGPWAGCKLATLKAPAGLDGVLTVTVFDAAHHPCAERLIFRRPAKDLEIHLSTDRSESVPGAKATVTITTTQDGKPVGATVGLTVSDDSVLKMLEQRDRPPRLAAMALLEPEVRELADSGVYLKDNGVSSTRDLDLLLGTQGWRRFALVDAAKFENDQGDAGDRALAIVHPCPPPPEQALGANEALADGAPGRVGGGVRPAIEKAGVVPTPALAPVVNGPENNLQQQPVMRIKDEKPTGALEADRADKMQAARQEQAQNPVPAAACMARLRPYYVREYAHVEAAHANPDERRDFTETVYWNAGVTTDPTTGKASVSFDLNDAVTTFHVFADGVAADGALGQADLSIQSVKPFYIEPKLPLELTAGDVVQLPVSFVNGTDAALAKVAFTMDLNGLHADAAAAAAETLDLAAHGRVRRLIDLTAGSDFGTKALTFRADAGAYRDSVSRSVAIEPLGFPLELSSGGTLAPNGAFEKTVTIPEEFVPGSVKTKLVLYATPLGNLNQAMERLIQEPCGCFEQTSSTNYPMTMAEQYFMSHTNADPSAVANVQEKLDHGYQRLTGFECSTHGYEWFGESPGHEALTAYGLMEFNDMEKVHKVDAAMVARTRAWLMKQRDGKGGFYRRRRALHCWIEDQDCSNGYILWSLLECGATGLEKEIASFKTASAASDNSYVWALGANVMSLAGDKAAAHALMQKLAERQDEKGTVKGAIAGSTASIVGSRGETLDIETTALAVLGWLRDPDFAGQVEQSIGFLNAACKDGRYGSTQSTVLALKAIIAHDRAAAHPVADGSLQLVIDGKPVGAPVAFTAATQGAIALPDFAPLMTAGSHTVGVQMQNGSALPYCLTVTCASSRPDSSPHCRLDLSTELNATKVSEGDAAVVKATVTNRSQKPAASPIAIIGIPAGLEPRHDQLKELVKAGTIDAYEVRGREVVLYWRSLPAGQQTVIPISVLAAVPGTYTAPASRAYEYYCDDYKIWTAGLKVTITPKP
ncbi:MAG: MG2 domain-containing protein [Planctomycetota bacterium]